MKTLCCALLLGLLAGLAPAQFLQARFDAVTATPTFPNGVPLRFGNKIVAIGDMTGDGISEYAVADCAYHGSQTISSLLNIGAVHIFDGAGVPATRINSFFGSASTDYFGYDLVALDDMDGDGINEIAASSISLTPGTARVRIISPGAGTTLRTIASPTPGAIFGLGMETVADVDGDGFRDLIVSEFGFATLFSANTGANLIRKAITNSTVGFTIAHAMAAYDANGDGFDDFLSGDPSTDSAVLYDGSLAAFGTVLNTLVGPSGSQFGADLAYLGKGPTNQRVVVGTPGAAAAEIWDADVFTAAVVKVIAGPVGSNFGITVASVAQLAADSEAMVSLSFGAALQACSYNQAGVQSFCIAAPTLFSVFSPGDVNGNGYGEIILSPNGAAGSSAYVYPGGPVATITNRGAGAAPAGMGTPILFVPFTAGRPTYGNAGFGFSYVVNQNGAAGALFVGNPAPQTLVFPPNYNTYLDLSSSASVSFVTANPNFTPLSIPASPGLAGVTLTAQVAAYGALGWEFTQAIDFTIGL